ncbi:bifunctional 2-C-methyl-D-erythritol 4-phosphate cytidylyltransferase/2-C-methyl-D-erythritol 2,4-cyclodiphosphate synthase [Palleronia sp. THAF1]|uniref:bifunctional 2-C-methyl-D-erythritol 4-phosphate cytidylyltransferase/2-C-methyl-D-erythritol 2,4-cyclodiphosphate synthase n=1 Tax=Palleronia sp. THAF1 TaxID=2587842 RepID=UPI000F5441D0|nr:bifunctional 2-C-methyl-D-erythritol 4-phosphate cytidylyltransferase/2-C-methyl-D-erythritol 2,4-cyclodiphosphate synthase [Palleronia sp. THAF1]
MKVAAVIVAAGRGTRAGGGVPKQWRDLGGLTVAARSIAAFRNHPRVGRVVLVLHPDDMGLAAGWLGHADMAVVAGGATRAQSVGAGLAALAEDTPDRVLIHDVARPLVSAMLIDRVIDALDTAPGAAPALAVTDALWTGDAGRVTGTQDREGLWRAQTPQGFHFAPILAAHRTAPADAADDVAVARAAGLDVSIVEGEERNLKITAATDFARAESYLGDAMDIRCGNGFDVHAFTEGDAVILCGVSIPHTHALLGHSDADVGMHTVTDAIYGALAEGDIGRHFPPFDPQWKGAASDIFLRHAAELAVSRGFVVSNVDLTLICEAPKIGPHAIAMAQTLAQIIGIDADRVSVKATTSEGLGFPGRKEGIAAMATVTLVSA